MTLNKKIQFIYTTSKYLNTYPRANVGELIGVYVVPGLAERLHSRRQVLHDTVACKCTSSMEDEQRNTQTCSKCRHIRSLVQPTHRQLEELYRDIGKTLWIKATMTLLLSSSSKLKLTEGVGLAACGADGKHRCVTLQFSVRQLVVSLLWETHQQVRPGSAGYRKQLYY